MNYNSNNNDGLFVNKEKEYITNSDSKSKGKVTIKNESPLKQI